MIIEYDILTKDTPDYLTVAVNEAIAGGWQPLGGVSVSLSESDDYHYIIFAQAIVRYAEQSVINESLSQWIERMTPKNR